MEPSLQTSFIPKQALNPAQVNRSAGAPKTVKSEGAGLFTLLSFVILFLSVAAAGGTFVYRNHLLNLLYSPCEVTAQTQPNGDILGQAGTVDSECGLHASLEDKRRKLDDESLSRMQRLDTKMKLATTVLNGHLSLLPLFDILSTSTLKTLRFTKFNTLNQQVNISGVASSYEDIAVQSEVLNDMPEIKNALFSNLDLDKEGNVIFNLTFSVSPSALTYRSIFLDNKAKVNSVTASSTI